MKRAQHLPGAKTSQALIMQHSGPVLAHPVTMARNSLGLGRMDSALRALYGLVFLQNHQSRIRTTIIRQLRMSSRTLAVSGEILHVEPKSTFVEHQTRLRLHTELALSKSSVGTDLAIGGFQAKVSFIEAARPHRLARPISATARSSQVS